MAMAVQRQRQRHKNKRRQDDEVVEEQDKDDVNIASVVVSAPVPQSIQFLESTTEDGNIDKEPPPQQQGQHAAAADLDPPATEVCFCIKCVPFCLEEHTHACASVLAYLTHYVSRLSHHPQFPPLNPHGCLNYRLLMCRHM